MIPARFGRGFFGGGLLPGLFIGGMRNPGDTASDSTTLTVGADEVTLASDANHPLH